MRTDAEPVTGIRNPVLRVLAYSHIWLALGAAAQVWLTSLAMVEDDQAMRVAAAILLLTIGGYTYMRTVRSRARGAELVPVLRWTSEHRTLLMIMGACCIAAGAALLWPFPHRAAQWCAFALMVSLPYVMPWRGKRTIGLRYVPALKAILIAAVWSVVTVAVPLQYQTTAESDLVVGLSVLFRALFFLALAIAFDIRDLPYDRRSLWTVPQLIGARTARGFAILLVLISAIFELLRLLWLDLSNAVFPAVFAYLITIILLLCATQRRSPLFYALLLDGALILVPAAVWLGIRI
ncbi:MAG: hypothetical protein WAU70_02200 [Flavobacteriales bacterium]